MNIRNWLIAFRLRTLPLSLSTVGMGIFLAIHKYRVHEAAWSYFTVVFLVLTTIALQILSNLANDYGDGMKGTDNENRVGPKRAVQSQLISKKQMKTGVIVAAVVAFIMGLLLLYSALGDANWQQIGVFLVLGIASIMAAILYTVGKKAYGYSGLGDVFVFVFFGWIGVGGAYYLLVLDLDFLVLLPASFIGLLSVGVLNMNNMRDVENDAASNKNTLVVKMGFEKAKIYHAIVLLLAFVCWIMFVILSHQYATLMVILPFTVLFKNIYTVWHTNVPATLDKELKKIALSTFMATCIYGTWVMFGA